MRRRKKASPDGGGHGHGGLQVTPLLDLFVALIPFLILSAAISKINVVDVKVSKPVAILKKNPKSQFNLLLKVDHKKIDVVLNGKTKNSIDVSSLESEDWKNSLHNKLVDIKKKHPAEFELKIEPTKKIKLEYIMSIMDSTRRLKTDDGKIIRKDEKSGKDVKVKFLFPKVTLRGVYG